MNPLSLITKAGEIAAKAKAFYSPLDKAIAEITQSKGTGQQIEAILKKTKGVTKELQDRPAVQALLKQPKVTKEQLHKAAAENPPAQIFEKVEKGPSDIKFKVEHDDLNNRYDVIDDYSNVVKSFRDYDDADAYATKLTSGTTSHEKWQLPGGKNYREIKLMLPQKTETGFVSPNGEFFTEAELSDPVVRKTAEKVGLTPAKRAIGEKFQSSHFPEPNILAHARVSDRVGPNGEKILHVEEIQSDWHQKGRKEGYQLPEGERKALDDRRQEIESYGINATPEQKQEWVGVMNRLQPESNFKKVPEAPFKQNWHELVMKRLLDDAVKKGYDKVVITPGAEQAKRYDLSKHFGELSYKHNEDGTVSIIGTDKKSGLANLHEEDIPQDKLSDYVGKELAEKIMSNAGTPYEGNSRMRQGSMTLSNLDLKVGGEGMEGFYDKMLPSFLNDYGKKWGANVGTFDLSVPRKKPIASVQDAIDQGLASKDDVLAMDQAQRNALLDSFRNETIPVHSFDITPQMREEITQKSQPLYQAAPVGIGAGTVAATQEEPPEGMAEGGQPERVYSDEKGAETPEQELQRYLRMFRINAMGGNGKYGTEFGGRFGVNIPISENVSIEPYVRGGAFKPTDGRVMGSGVGGANLNIRFKNGGDVKKSMDAMCLALMNKQLRKHHG